MEGDGEDLSGGKIEEAQLDPKCVSRMHPVVFGQLLTAVILTLNGREGTPDVRTSTYTYTTGKGATGHLADVIYYFAEDEVGILVGLQDRRRPSVAERSGRQQGQGARCQHRTSRNLLQSSSYPIA